MLNFGSKITRKLLGYYFINPGSACYVNELARILNLDPGNLDRKLKELEKTGIFSSEKRGNQKYFFLNRKYPLLDEIEKMYNFNFGVKKKLSSALSKVKGIQEAYIFGSYAKNKMKFDSDIDILLVGAHSSLDAKRAVSKLEKDLQRELNIVDMSPSEFLKRKKREDEFIANIFKNKIIKLDV